MLPSVLSADRPHGREWPILLRLFSRQCNSLFQPHRPRPLLLLFQLVFKAVADFADGVDERRAMRVGLDLAPQRGDATIHTARGNHDGVAPDSVHDAVPSECAPGVLEKV